MHFTRLGRTALKVSRICLGTMNFGPQTTEAGLARDHGPRALARDQLLRHRERLRLEEGRGRDRADRRAVVRAGRRPAREGRPRDEGVRRRWATGPTSRACRLSTSGARARTALRRLKTDHIDLYQMHHVDRDAPWDEIWQAMEMLVQQGKVLYVGSSNFAGWHIARAYEAARSQAFPRARLRAVAL